MIFKIIYSWLFSVYAGEVGILRGENCLLVFVSVLFTRINNCRLTYKYNINKYLQTSNFKLYIFLLVQHWTENCGRLKGTHTKIYIYDPTPYLI